MFDKKPDITIFYRMHSYDILFERYPGVISFKTGTAQFLGSFAGLDPPATNGGFSVFDDRSIHEFLSATWPPLQGILKGNHMMFSEVLVSGRLDLPKLLTCNTPQGGCASPHFAGPHSPFPRLMIRKAAKRSKDPKWFRWPSWTKPNSTSKRKNMRIPNSCDSSVFSLMVSTPLQNYVS